MKGSEELIEKKFIQYTLEHKPIPDIKINGEDCYKIAISHNGMIGNRTITESEKRALKDAEKDTTKFIELLKKHFEDSPKTFP